ncbi:MAG: Crp/Fnr family transcriptional regulator [Oscillospiraceae bacterium]|jgi:CRP-like cAMP-binding protein
MKGLRQKDAELVYTCFLFENIPQERVDSFLEGEGVQLRRYRKGEVIFDREHHSPSLGLVLSGSVLVSSPSGSRNLVMRELGPGDIFGAAGLFTEERDYVTTLTAKGPCRVLFISQDLLRRAMAEDFTLAENYIRFLSGRVRFLNRKISGLAAGTAEETLAIYLSGSGGEVEIPSYSRLAEELGLGRASLYRALESLEKSGHIKRNGHVIHIPNPEALKEMIQ